METAKKEEQKKGRTEGIARVIVLRDVSHEVSGRTLFIIVNLLLSSSGWIRR
jgi:hypothetical protein